MLPIESQTDDNDLLYFREKKDKKLHQIRRDSLVVKHNILLGSHNWVDCLATELFLNSCFSDTVLVTLFRTTVKTAVSEVHKLLRAGEASTSLTSFFWR